MLMFKLLKRNTYDIMSPSQHANGKKVNLKQTFALQIKKIGCLNRLFKVTQRSYIFG